MRPLFVAIAAAVFAAGMLSQAVRADLGAMATISVNPITDDAGMYDYTITVQNTGDTDIGTFWYAWQPGRFGAPDYNFLTTTPNVTGQPNGWYPNVTGGQPFGDGFDGYGVEWYNIGGSAIPAGGSGTFTFSSFDSPDMLAGDSSAHPGFPTQTSFVYIGTPESDPGATFVVAAPTSPAPPAPEPASLALLACGMIPLLHRSRKNCTVPPR